MGIGVCGFPRKMLGGVCAGQRALGQQPAGGWPTARTPRRLCGERNVGPQTEHRQTLQNRVQKTGRQEQRKSSVHTCNLHECDYPPGRCQPGSVNDLPVCDARHIGTQLALQERLRIGSADGDRSEPWSGEGVIHVEKKAVLAAVQRLGASGII